LKSAQVLLYSMGNKSLPKLTHGYLRCNKILTQRSRLR